ncbi:MAG TPA: hypothetical protein VMB18_09230 [Terriglobales bacterium]|nr:hypothetical protein [Terriglobales bacterium]
MYPKLQLVLWLAHPVLELSLAVAMILRGLHRKFPVFFSYIVFELASFAVLFPIQRHGMLMAYFYGYWISAMISLALGFKVIHEVFLDVFRPFHTLRDLGTVLFKWAALVMIFVAIVVAVAGPSGHFPLVQAVTTLQRCVRTIQCGLILFLLLFSRYLGVSWRQYSFGIALGFGTYAIVELGTNALYFGGQIKTPSVGLLNTMMYAGSLLAWVGYSFLKVPARQELTALLAPQRWEESLSDLRRPAPADSLIPMFEGMVDRAFSHSSFEGESETQETQETLVPQSVPLNPVAATFALRRAASQR